MSVHKLTSVATLNGTAIVPTNDTSVIVVIDTDEDGLECFAAYLDCFERLDVCGYGETADDAVSALHDDIAFAWKTYAMGRPGWLGPLGKELREKLLASFREDGMDGYFEVGHIYQMKGIEGSVVDWLCVRWDGICADSKMMLVDLARCIAVDACHVEPAFFVEVDRVVSVVEPGDL